MSRREYYDVFDIVKDRLEADPLPDGVRCQVDWRRGGGGFGHGGAVPTWGWIAVGYNGQWRKVYREGPQSPRESGRGWRKRAADSMEAAIRGMAAQMVEHYGSEP